MKLRGTNRWVAYALIVWLGGLGCLAGCFAETYAAPVAHADHTQAAQSESECTDGCCKKKGSNSEPDSQPQPAQDMDCCLYLTAPPATLAKKAAAPVPAATLVPTLSGTPSAEAVASSFEFRRIPLFDSSGTYLRIRALRI